MNRSMSGLAVAALCLVFGAAAQAAPKSALSPASPNRSAANQASLLLGFGFNDAYNTGLGVRGLHTLEGMPITVGGSFNYYFGSSEDLPGSLGGGSTSVSSFTILGEVGYELRDLGLPVQLRPYVGLGLFSASSHVQGVGSSNAEFGFVPGVVAEYNLTPDLFVGAEAKLNIVSDNTALALFALVGTRF